VIAAQVVGVDQLLPGEDPASDDIEDIHHWMCVYAELLAGCQVLARHVDTGTVPPFLGRIERRLAYWRSKIAAAVD
jgi:hypothetical protein